MKFINKIRIKYLVIFSLIFAFISCKNETKKNREHLVFRYNEHANITSLDPTFAKDQRNIWPCNQLYNGLVQLDDSLTIQPDLAKKWSISEDAKTYTFFLRDDVFFHKHKIFGKNKTRKVTSEDVVFSLKRLTDPKIASPGSWVMQNVSTISAENDSVVKIELSQPFPAFLGLLSMKYCSVIPTEMKKLDFRENPIGTGPFKFKRWEANEKLVFRKNNLYFETDKNSKQLPYLEAIAITFLPDKQSEFLQFAQGNIDFLSGLDPSYKDELLSVRGKLREKYASRVNMLTAPYLNTEYLGIYLDSKTDEVNAEKIRQAINYGFNRETMITYLRNGIGTPANQGFIPKGLPGFSSKIYYDYNPEKAKKLINDYKENTGNSNPEISISTNAQYLDLCEYIQRELQKIGLTVNIDVMPPSTLRQQRSAGKLDIFRASWIADYPDAENYLSLFYSENFSPNGPNYTHFKNETFDELYEEAINTSSAEKRVLLYKKMDSIIMKNAPVVPLYYDEVIRFTQKNINGLGINPINLLDLKRVKKEKN
ncbi:ABC transporter substrate-binding protein [Mesonia maritima]|uniref:Peptide/nickel transport system substrate-binding protein n=1 Tax=Mesonia maritima TaxID=1793873 RepID=A0ABU1K6Y5_9FLAO|nr:ABC transporter substrate-binding protein [Mesonia maritima]MDR6300777.1 peptide/nickel transport system substrate-binding protein [Mesonia maritima]